MKNLATCKTIKSRVHFVPVRIEGDGSENLRRWLLFPSSERLQNDFVPGEGFKVLIFAQEMKTSEIHYWSHIWLDSQLLALTSFFNLKVLVVQILRGSFTEGRITKMWLFFYIWFSYFRMLIVRQDYLNLLTWNVRMELFINRLPVGQMFIKPSWWEHRWKLKSPNLLF